MSLVCKARKVLKEILGEPNKKNGFDAYDNKEKIFLYFASFGSFYLDKNFLDINIELLESTFTEFKQKILEELNIKNKERVDSLFIEEIKTISMKEYIGKINKVKIFLNIEEISSLIGKKRIK